MSNLKTIYKKTDPWLLFCYIALVIIGWVNIYASIHADTAASIFDIGNRAGKQFLWIMVSIAAGAVVLAINSRIYEVVAFWAYLGTALLLFVTIFLGKDINGSHSWLSIGPVSFQPAELSKITTSMMLASMMSQFGFRINTPRNLARTVAIILIPPP